MATTTEERPATDVVEPELPSFLRRRPRGHGPIQPTLEAILGRAQELRDLYKHQDEQIDLGRRLRELTELTPLPPRLTRVKGMEMADPTILDEIQRVRSSLNARPPHCIITASDPASDEGQENATLREHFTEQMFLQAGTRVPGQSTHEQILDAAVGDGAAWAKLVFDTHLWDNVWNLDTDEDYWPEDDDVSFDAFTRRTRPKEDQKYLADREDAKKVAGVPLRWICCDTRQVYPVWSGTRLVECLEISERPTLQVLSEYDLEFGGDDDRRLYGQGASKQETLQYPNVVTFIEHWTPTWVSFCIELGGERAMLRQIQHNYGHVPYYFMPGEMANYWRGRKVGSGVWFNKKDLVRQRQFLWNLVVQICAQTAGTPLQHTRPQGGEAVEGDDQHPQGETQMWELNGIYEAQPGEKWEPIPLPGVPAPLRELLEILNKMIADLDTPRVRSVDNVEGGAGFGIAQVLVEAKTRFKPYSQHVEQGYIQATRDAWKLLRMKLDEDETIYVQYTPAHPRADRTRGGWLGVRPQKDLTDNVGIQWLIDPEPPTAEIVKARLAHERKERGTFSNDMAIEFLGDNPDEVRRGLIADRLRNEGFYIDYANQLFLQELEIGDMLREAAEQVAQTGVFPGMPPELAQMLQPGAPMGGAPEGQPGAPMIPDMAALAQQPQGQGVPLQPSPYRNGPGPGPLAGVGPGFVGPQQAMQAGVQRLGPGG